MLFSFGQPIGGIIQTAFIVPDLDVAMQAWVRDFKVGPWFVITGFKGEDAEYRGEKTDVEIDAAMAFAGHMQIELIQQKDELPSVYKEIRDSRGFGFHHFGFGTANMTSDGQRLSDIGYDLAYRAKVPTGDYVAYYDTKGALPGFIELIEASKVTNELFSRFYQASIEWDGSDPYRRML